MLENLTNSASGRPIPGKARENETYFNSGTRSLLLKKKVFTLKYQSEAFYD
jgi:hypothetical protein